MNPSAFPIPPYNHPGGDFIWPEPGMTLRDYFAAKALSLANENNVNDSIVTASKRLGINSKDYDYSIHYPQLLAKDAYAIADAMLIARIP